MASRKSTNHLRTLFLTAFAALVISGCGGGGSAEAPVVSIPDPVQMATVTVLLTDAPSDEFDQIFVSISSIELLGGSEQVVLFEGDETIDLLMLENFADLFAISDDVPPDSYNKIRLRITDIELVQRDDDGNIVESIHPDLPANGKLDLNPRGPIEIAPGANVVLQLDMDARRSIHIVGTGSDRYKFRPVVFVDVVNEEFDTKSVRIKGDVIALDEANGTIEVCQQNPTSSDNDSGSGLEHCVIVNTNDQTGFFDSNAESAAFADLLVGDSVTVIGMFDSEDSSMFYATVVAIDTEGDFGRYEGVVLSAVDSNNTFSLLLNPGQGFTADTEIGVNVQPGTGLSDDNGNPLDIDAIQPNIEAEIDGLIVLNTTDPDVLRAIYIALEIESDDDSSSDDEVRLAGQVMSVDVATNSLTLATEDGDRCLVMDDDADIFLITVVTDGTTTDSIDLTDVAIDAAAEAYGEEQADGCLHVSTLLVLE